MSVPQALRVFISSKDALSDERTTTEDALRSLYAEPVRVETTTWVATGRADEYLKQVAACDLLVLILEIREPADIDQDDYYNYVEQEVELAFGEGKTVLAFIKTTSTTAGVNYFLERVQHRVFRHDFRDCMELRASVRASVLNEVYQRYKSAPSVLTSKRDHYVFTAESIAKCRYRLYLCQATPTPLLGPRLQRDYERRLFDEFFKLIQRNNSSAKPAEIAVLYDLSVTRNTLANRADEYDIASMRANIDMLRNAGDQPLYVIDAADEMIPFMVVDHTYGIGHTLLRRTLAVVDSSPQVVSELTDLVHIETSASRHRGIDAFEKLLDDLE